MATTISPLRAVCCSSTRIRDVEKRQGFTPFSAVEKQCVSIAAASLADQRSDEERILEAFGWEGGAFSYGALAKLPQVMKEKEESLITLTHREGWIIDVEAGDREKENYGLFKCGICCFFSTEYKIKFLTIICF